VKWSLVHTAHRPTDPAQSHTILIHGHVIKPFSKLEAHTHMHTKCLAGHIAAYCIQCLVKQSPFDNLHHHQRQGL